MDELVFLEAIRRTWEECGSDYEAASGGYGTVDAEGIVECILTHINMRLDHEAQKEWNKLPYEQCVKFIQQIYS